MKAVIIVIVSMLAAAVPLCLANMSTRPATQATQPADPTPAPSVEAARKATEFRAAQLEVAARERVLKSYTSEIDAIIVAIKTKPASPELDQLLIDAVTRHQKALIDLEDARNALNRLHD
jgi:hypothetical protein